MMKIGFAQISYASITDQSRFPPAN